MDDVGGVMFGLPLVLCCFIVMVLLFGDDVASVCLIF